MSIWRNKPLEHIIVPKPFITLEEQDFITELSVEIPKHLLTSTMMHYFGKTLTMKVIIVFPNQLNPLVIAMIQIR